MKRPTIIFILLLIQPPMFAQQRDANIPFVAGTVIDANRQPLQGAIVRFFDRDSVLLASSVTDSVGSFHADIKTQDIRVVATLLGYESRYLVVKDTRRPLKIMLKHTDNMIGEVVVKGRSMVRKDDKLMIYLPEQTKKNAYDGYSALSSLNIPGLRVNMFDQAVTTHGATTLLCINGREVKADEISTLNPADIKRIDYYQMQDPNHPGADAVIDFVMKNRNNGGQVFAKANHNLNIGKGGATVDVKQYVGRTELNAQLSGKYTHYTPDEGELSTTVMPFNDETISKQVTTEASPQRNNSTTARLALLHQWKNGEKNNMFNVAAYLKKGHTVNRAGMTEAYNDELTISHNNKHSDYFSPMLQLYYEGNLNSATL